MPYEDQEFMTLKEAKKIAKKLTIEETFVREEEEEEPEEIQIPKKPIQKGLA